MRRSRAASDAQWRRLKDALYTLMGAATLFHEFFMIAPKDWDVKRLPLALVAAAVLTGTIAKPSGDTIWSVIRGVGQVLNERKPDDGSTR